MSLCLLFICVCVCVHVFFFFSCPTASAGTLRKTMNRSGSNKYSCVMVTLLGKHSEAKYL